MNKICLLLSLIVIFISAHAQAPVNDEPCGAIVLPILESADACTPIPISITNATYSNLSIAITCGASEDVWFKFTPAAGVSKMFLHKESIANGYFIETFTAGACNGTFTTVNTCIYINGDGDYELPVVPAQENYMRLFKYDGVTNHPNFTVNICLYSGLPSTTSKVGINTKFPNANLDIAGNVRVRDSINIKNVNITGNFKLSSGLFGVNKVLTSDANGFASWQPPVVQSNYWSLIGSNVFNNNGGSVGIGTSTPTSTLTVAGSADFSGNVGINFLGASEKLQVNGNIKLGTEQIWQNATNDRVVKFGDLDIVSIGERFGDDELHLRAGQAVVFRTASDLERMRINFSGNVGIGTSSPNTAKLVIGGPNGTEGIDLASADQYANMRVIRNNLFGPDKDMFIGFGSGANSSLHLYSNNIETITAKNANVGIGNSDPAYLLDISKRIRLRSESTSFGAGIWFNKNDNSSENIFLGNDVSNNLQVYSLIGSRTIASFNPSTGGLRVEGPVAASSGNFLASFGGNGDFVIDKPGQVGGRLSIKENGAIAVGGAANTGTTGQVLTSNGGSASPTWKKPIQFDVNTPISSTVSNNITGVRDINNFATYTLIPGSIRTITIPTGQNAILLYNVLAQYNGNGCSGLGCNSFASALVFLDGNNILGTNYYNFDVNNGQSGDISINNLAISVGPGTHTIDLRAAKSFVNVNDFLVYYKYSSVLSLPN